MGYLKLKRLTSTKTKNYLRYAFGEVFLVVMGILIALQVNNWNEKYIKKNFVAETKQDLLIDAYLKTKYCQNK